jgi:hypothetical protein
MKRFILIGLLLLVVTEAQAARFADNTAGVCASGTYRITQRDCGGAGTGHQSYATITTLQAAMLGGETAYVRAGTYTAGFTATLPNGTSGAPTIVAGCPATVCATQETPTIQTTGFPFNIVTKNYLTFRNFLVSMCNQSGTDAAISLNASTNVTTEDIEINGCAGSIGPNGVGSGYFISAPSGGGSTGHIIRRNYIHDIGGNATSPNRWHGVYINAKGVTIEHSRFERICNYSIHGFSGGSNTDQALIRYNKIDQDGIVSSHPLCSSGGGDNTSAILMDGFAPIIVGNQITRGADSCIVVARGSGGIIYNNSCRDTGPYSGNGIEISGSYSNANVKNNVLQNSGTITFVGSGSSSHNRCDSVSAHCQNTLTPGFTSTTDLTLTASSALIDACIAAVGALPSPLVGTVTAVANGSAPDCGAFETITFASAAASTTGIIDITFGAAFGPLSTLSSCSGITVRQAGVTKTCTGFANNGNATYRWTCTACLSAGGGTIDIAITAGKFTDSVGVGGTINQSNFALPTTTVTNNISGATEVFTVLGVRQRTYARVVSDTIGAAWIKAENATGSVRVDNGKFAGWWLIGCTGANCPAVGLQFEQNLNAGSYANTTDSCITNPLCFDSTNSAAPHGTTIADCMLTNPHGNCLAGAVAAQSSGYPVLDLAQNQAAPIQGNFAIKSGLSVGDVICVRPKLDSGAAITHNQTFCVNVVNPAGSPA